MALVSHAVKILLLCGACLGQSANVNTSPAALTCASTLCAPGFACRLQVIYCLIPPCPPPVPVCRQILKIGFCPVPTPGQIGICLVRCTTDADCHGNSKCCGNCPRTCKAPIVEKPGRCPIMHWPGPCIAKCTIDGDCPGRQKCCGSCPRMCRKPFVGWQRRCRNHRDCRGRRRRRCCRGRCRRRCHGFFPWPLFWNDDK